MGIPPDVRGITFSGGVINLSIRLEVVLAHPKLLAQVANSAIDGLRGVTGAHAAVRTSPLHHGVRCKEAMADG